MSHSAAGGPYNENARKIVNAQRVAGLQEVIDRIMPFSKHNMLDVLVDDAFKGRVSDVVIANLKGVGNVRDTLGKLVLGIVNESHLLKLAVGKTQNRDEILKVLGEYKLHLGMSRDDIKQWRKTLPNNIEYPSYQVIEYQSPSSISLDEALGNLVKGSTIEGLKKTIDGNTLGDLVLYALNESHLKSLVGGGDGTTRKILSAIKEHGLDLDMRQADFDVMHVEGADKHFSIIAKQAQESDHGSEHIVAEDGLELKFPNADDARRFASLLEAFNHRHLKGHKGVHQKSEGARLFVSDNTIKAAKENIDVLEFIAKEQAQAQSLQM